MKRIFKTRRYCLISLVLLFVGSENLSLASADTSTSNKPNVLFIAVDDLRPELGCYGAKHIHSPNIDRFARTSLLLQRAYCQQAVCNPSRTSLMTGLRPDTIGVTGNHIHFRSNMPDVVTLPQHFKNHGYHAAAIGKIYHGVFPQGSSITKWDTMGDPKSWSEAAIRFGPRYYYTEEGVAAAKEVYKRIYKAKNPGPEDWTTKLVFGPATEAPDVDDNVLFDGKVAETAVEKLAELKHSKKPFFLAVGFIKPHSPYIAPQKYFDLYHKVSLASDPRLPEGAPNVSGHSSGELRRYTDQPDKGPIPESNQLRVRQAYYACVSYIDAQIGKVLNQLDKLELDNNTIVCLYGDHGYHLGEQGLWGKTTNFELDTRVPLMVRAPGMKSLGKVSNSLVELVDIYPTLTELAGLQQPTHLEGRSFVPLLDDPNKETKNFACSQFPRSDGLMGYSMRTSDHRLTHWIHRKTGQIRATELYDYTDNQIESVNVATQAAYAQLRAKLTIEFNKAFEKSLVSTSTLSPKRKVKVACVGDSITFGAGISDRANNSYPSLLQKMLGSNYEVGNFGFSGATLLKKGHKPYWEKSPYAASLAFMPDVVVINLGANDAVDMNWKYGSEFMNDYTALLDSYRKLPSNPKLYACEILPMFSNHGRFEECMANRKPMSKLVREVSKSASIPLIDLKSPFVGRNDLFPDGLHPNEEGAMIMAKTIYHSLIGKTAPMVNIVQPQQYSNENGTSFENANAGAFAELETAIGIWKNLSGDVLVDNKHSKTGKQCLHITGGENGSSVELALAKSAKTDGQLSFWAERWTVRNPFSFRIEKQSRGRWSEIFNADQAVRVGREFLSHVKIPLEDKRITKLRFTVNSPPNTGVLIDDIVIAPAEPMKIKCVETVPLALPALKGNEQSAVVKVKITTAGTIESISIKQIKARMFGISAEQDIESCRIFFGGNNSNFRWDKPFGKAANSGDGKPVKFVGNQRLLAGDNYVWLACTLNKNANIDSVCAGSIDSIEFSNGKSIQLNDQTSFQRMGVAVRKGHDDGVHTYRIPGLATTNAGTLIGVYDIRRDGGGDLPGNIDVGMSRSTDGGQTWEPMKVIMDMGSDPRWRGDGIGDPAVLVDRNTGTIWVSATWSHGNRSWRGSGPGLEPEETGQWILVKSDDDGKSWSEPINITKQVKNPEWSFILQGPGKGITMLDGTIVFPAQYQDPPNSKNKKANRLPHSTIIYSRDHGKTWQTATSAWEDTTESQIVELADGELMINCRNNRASKRAVMTSKDMGASWQPHSTHIRDLIEPGSCMASLINVDRELKWRELRASFGKNILLFSNPDSLRSRNHMTIKASTDGGVSWPEKHHLLLDEQSGAGYSCMTMIDEQTVGILYEGSQAQMTFQRIKIESILNPPTNHKTKNPARVKKK